MTTPNMNAIIGVDVGGTFTDFVVFDNGVFSHHKVLSTPDNPATAVLRGLEDLSISSDVAIVHGSTVATNALLERKGARTALVTTEGFEDVLEIGRQNRSELYDLMMTRPTPLVPSERRLGAPERVDSQGAPLLELTRAAARNLAIAVKDLKVESVAVCFLFSFLHPTHELLMKEVLKMEEAAPYIYISQEVLPEYREYERTSTTVVNAFIAPVVDTYLGKLRDSVGDGLRIMQSSGGSVTPTGAMALPVQTISGGPAAGVVGGFHVAKDAGYPHVITFDMGGTSTDVALCLDGVPQTSDWSVGGQPIRTTAVDLYSVGAGGGSIARVDRGGALLVGPESAGANPGPACYGSGVEATVTDANLLLGRLDLYRPLGGRVSLQLRRAQDSLAPLAEGIGASIEEVAFGVLRVVNAHMERAIRVISVERGHDPRDFTLVAFGGAGPMHACELAEGLGLPRVLIPHRPGVLSAQGMTMVDVTREYVTTVMVEEEELMAGIDNKFEPLRDQGLTDLGEMGIFESDISNQCFLDMRYVGQSHELSIPYTGPSKTISTFHAAHRKRYGNSHDRPIEVVNVRMKIVGSVAKPVAVAQMAQGPDSTHALIDRRAVFFDGEFLEVDVYDREGLCAGNLVYGPALLLQEDSTVVIPVLWSAVVDDYLNLVIEKRGGSIA